MILQQLKKREKCQQNTFPKCKREGKKPHHITSTGKFIVDQALQSHPADWSVLVVPQAVVVHGEQVPGQRVVRDLHLQCIVNAGHREEHAQQSQQHSFTANSYAQPWVPHSGSNWGVLIHISSTGTLLHQDTLTLRLANIITAPIYPVPTDKHWKKQQAWLNKTKHLQVQKNTVKANK